jgi:hypothetical protein
LFQSRLEQNSNLFFVTVTFISVAASYLQDREVVDELIKRELIFA